MAPGDFDPVTGAIRNGHTKKEPLENCFDNVHKYVHGIPGKTTPDKLK